MEINVLLYTKLTVSKYEILTNNSRTNKLPTKIITVYPKCLSDVPGT